MKKIVSIAITLSLYLCACNANAGNQQSIVINGNSKNLISQTSTTNALNQNSQLISIKERNKCDNLTTRQEYENCLQNQLEEIELKLNHEFTVAVERVKKYHTQNDADNLLNTQKIWLSYRNSECQAEKNLYGEGVDAIASTIECQIILTKGRIETLKRVYGSK